jgi:hypothetical protein
MVRAAVQEQTSLACVVAIIEHLGVRAIDSSTGNFFNPSHRKVCNSGEHTGSCVGSTGDT